MKIIHDNIYGSPSLRCYKCGIRGLSFQKVKQNENRRFEQLFHVSLSHTIIQGAEELDVLLRLCGIATVSPTVSYFIEQNK